MKNQIRAFIAVNLSVSVRQSISKLIGQLQPVVGGTKWVEPRNLHVTLKFLGDVPMNELHRIIDAVRRGAERVDAFDLEFSGCGAFPDASHPRTIWVGCQQGSSELERLAAAVEDELYQLGYPKESRRFSPHLTIGRVKQTEQVGEEFADFLKTRQSFPYGSCGVDEVILYSSELTRQGPNYDELATISLK